MELSFTKIKSIPKEKKRGIAYMAATIVIIGLTLGFFIWAVNIVLQAVDASFVSSGEEDVSSEILSFNMDEFAKIAPRLGIKFSLEGVNTPVKANPVPAPTPEIPLSTPTSTATSSTSTILESRGQ
jgi:hypothetical protein